MSQKRKGRKKEHVPEEEETAGRTVTETTIMRRVKEKSATTDAENLQLQSRHTGSHRKRKKTSNQTITHKATATTKREEITAVVTISQRKAKVLHHKKTDYRLWL